MDITALKIQEKKRRSYDCLFPFLLLFLKSATVQGAKIGLKRRLLTIFDAC